MHRINCIVSVAVLAAACGSHGSSPAKRQTPAPQPVTTPNPTATPPASPPAAASNASGLIFATDINPILQSACGPCHGKAAGLGLPAFVGDEPMFIAYGEDITSRITSTDPGFLMPQPGGGTTLSAADRDKILKYLGAASG